MQAVSHKVVARGGLSRTSRAGLVAIAMAASCLVGPAVAWSAVTIGSDLSSSEDVLLGCPTPAPCTAVQTQLPGHQFTSPIDGVIVPGGWATGWGRWRCG